MIKAQLQIAARSGYCTSIGVLRMANHVYPNLLIYSSNRLLWSLILAMSIMIFPSEFAIGAPQVNDYQTDGKSVTLDPYKGPQDTPQLRFGDFPKEYKPFIRQALSSYPKARARFLAGLPDDYSFFVTVILRSPQASENAFFKVERIVNGKVTGILVTKLIAIKSFNEGQRYTFPEREIIDWTITSPSGSEEGNFVGKYIDSQNGDSK